MSADWIDSTDYLSGEGLDCLTRLRKRRHARAAKLKELRKAIPVETFKPGTLRYRNDAIRRLAGFNYEDEPRPTYRALMAEANRLNANARGPLPGAPGCDGTYVMDDGYSLCGLADAHAEMQEDMAREALLLTAAARWARS